MLPILHSALMETHAFGFRLRANAPEGQKRFPISSGTRHRWKNPGDTTARFTLFVCGAAHAGVPAP
ncbi:MAG: hypothetical protein WCC08_03225 [Terrimicrobiaceae bacterium]